MKRMGGPPSSRSPADVDGRPLFEMIISAVESKYQACDEGKGEYLSLVGVAGELEVEKTRRCFMHNRLMLEEEGKLVAGKPGKQFFLWDSFDCAVYSRS